MPAPQGFDDLDVVIASGAALSAPIAINLNTLVGVFIPATWTAADITFQVSRDGGSNYHDIVDAEGTEVSLTGFSAGDYVMLPAGAFNGLRLLKLRSGTSASPVNQAAARTLYLACRSFE